MATSRSTDAARAELRSRGVTATAVLDRALILLGLTKDAELAEVLGVSRSVLSTWRSRNAIPFEELLALHYNRHFDFVACLLGRPDARYRDERYERLLADTKALISNYRATMDEWLDQVDKSVDKSPRRAAKVAKESK